MSLDLSLIPISGEHASFHSSVAQVGPFMVLLDCGWTEELNPEDINTILPYLEHIDVILLSKGSTKHVAAYPYIFERLRKDCVVLCTEPVRYLGELICLSLVEELEKYKNVETLDTDTILRAFMDPRIKNLKYTEPYERKSVAAEKGIEARLTITPYQAGGSLGATYWIVQLDSSQMVYCSGFSLRDTRHVGGMDFVRLMDPPDLRTPAVMVMSLAAVRSDVPHLGYTRTPVSENVASIAGSSSRVCLTCGEAFFLDKTVETLRDGGSVILPMDMTGTIFDIMLLLDEAWSADSSLTDKFPICWVSCYGDIFLDQIKTRLEFMCKRVQRLFEERPDKKNPFVMHNIRMYPTISDMHLHVLPRQPKVVIANFPGLECGDSRELIVNMAKEPQNLLWLTLPWYPDGSLAAQIFEDFVTNKSSEKEYSISHHAKRPLAENQLKNYYDEKVEEEARMKNLKKKPLRTIQEEETEQDWKNTHAGTTTSNIFEHPKAGETFFQPSGWLTKTIIHSDYRRDTDDYGQLLSEQEIETWQLTAENKEGIILQQAQNAKKITQSASDSMNKDSDWLQDLRVRFGEPMRSEIKWIPVKVACKVLYCEFESHDHRDTRALLLKSKPQQVVVLPTTVNCEFESLHANMVHFLQGPQTFNWRPLKRRATLSDGLWEKLAFQKLNDGSKICTVLAIAEDEELHPYDNDIHRDTLLMSVPRLTDLRTHLQRIVPEAVVTFQEVQSTRLLDINEKVRLGMKNGSIRLEGSVSEEFYSARELLYERSVWV